MMASFNFLPIKYRQVERITVPNSISGSSKFRFGLTLLALLSFSACRIYLNHRSHLDWSPFLLHSELYCIHNFIRSAIAFVSVPLADFQVFEYDSKFWSIFKTLASFDLLGETEAIAQFVYGLSNSGKGVDGEDNKKEEMFAIVFSLFVISAIRWILLMILFVTGSRFLQKITQSRHLPANTYPNLFWRNIAEFVILQLTIYVLFTFTNYSVVVIVCIEVLLLTIYLIVRDVFFAGNIKQA